jgi:hypothetical protein
MNLGFTKLFSSIVTSTIWAESNPTRIVWITMLALADKHGEVGASIPGLARAANVSIDECKVAIDAFLSTDEYSRTKDHDGRRIEAIDGGWRLINYAKYRDAMRSLDRTEYLRIKQAEYRERKRASTVSTTSTSLNQFQPIAEAEAEAESNMGVRPTTLVKRSAEASPASDSDWRKELAENPAYVGIDVEREFAKMGAWCQLNRKQPSRRRFLNWLNRADRPMAGVANGTNPHQRAAPTAEDHRRDGFEV